MASYPAPERAKAVDEAVLPKPAPEGGLKPESREDETTAEPGLVNPELDRQTSIARPPLGN